METSWNVTDYPEPDEIYEEDNNDDYDSYMADILYEMRVLDNE